MRLTKVESLVCKRSSLVFALSETMVKEELETFRAKPKESTVNSSPAFLDLTNSQSPSVDVFRIPAGVLSKTLDAYRGRTNLAGRLALMIFTEEERKESNCRGVLGKKTLDFVKLQSIKEVCVKEYPITPNETRESVNKEIRSSIDEVCRRKIKKNPVLVLFSFTIIKDIRRYRRYACRWLG